MDNGGRQKFWEQLLKTRDNTPQTMQDLCAALPYPSKLCRFRPVSESTLKQVQDNKLYFSSAYFYDDPFDTYIHIDIEGIKKLHSFINDNLDKDDSQILNYFKFLEPITRINAEALIKRLKDNPLDMSRLEEALKNIRTIIQKNLFSICFCENTLNETLWLKYANNYKGFALVYNMNDEETFLCGKEEICKKCRQAYEKPTAYPVYYSQEEYNATLFAIVCLLWAEQNSGNMNLSPEFLKLSYQAVMWEAERISLIKKKCHEYDEEWRMIRPSMMPERTYIKMKPKKVILGLRMPEYERRLVVSAAKVAGIEEIEELYINDKDKLDTKKRREK